MKINNQEIKGIIFDLDGTLLDSCSIWSDVDERFFKKRNLIMPDDYQKAIGHIGLEKAAIYTINRFNLNEDKDAIINEWKQGVLEIYQNEVKLKPNVKKFLSFLKENNIPFCAATANDEDCYKSALINNQIYEMFDFILEVNNIKDGKDKPTIYIEAANKMNVKINQCMVFEDLYQAIETVKKAGFISVGVFEKTNQEEEKKKLISDFYIKDFNEIINLFKQNEE